MQTAGISGEPVFLRREGTSRGGRELDTDAASGGSYRGASPAPLAREIAVRRHAKLGSCLLAAAVLAMSGSALAQATPSAADLQSARAAFREGMQLRAAGKTAEALRPLRTAHELAHTPITALELGRTLVTLGHVVEGTELLLEAQRLPKAYDESAKGAAARVEAGKLAAESGAKIATLRVTLHGASAEAQVKIDGEVVKLAVLSLGRKLDPGPHTVVAANPRAPEATAKVDLKPGETQDTTLHLEPSPVVAPPPVVVAPPPPVVIVPPPVAMPVAPPPPEPPPSTTWRTVAIAGFGVAGVGAVVGAITGGVAMGAASAAEKGCAGTTCPSDTFSRIEAGRGAAPAAPRAGASGGGGRGGGGVGLLMKPAAREQRPATSVNAVHVEPWLSTTSAGMRGTF